MLSPELDRKLERGFEENLKRDCSHASPNSSEVFKFYSRLLRALGSSHFQIPGESEHSGVDHVLGSKSPFPHS